VNLSGHVTLWVVVMLVCAMAPMLARRYVAWLEARSRARTDALISRLSPPNGRGEHSS
jgi:hypothetical protein